MSLLTIENLSFGYTPHKLLYSDFNLTLAKGELVAIVGKSGSGKSTLFELISGNLKPQKGTITVGKIGWIFQDPYSSFHPTFTILNQIGDVASLDGARELCADMGLPYELLTKLPHRLSGGQLQRCSILRALLMKPDLILCDEPTSALDNVTQLDVMKLLVKYLDKIGIVLITHDMDLAKWASDTTITLDTQANNP